ncbi:unnamed protein product, partial [Porites lobata]
MIEQYLEYCKEQCHKPLSRSSLFKILEVREASQRKSLQGLDNTAAHGAAGYQTIETLVETLEKGGMEKQWCLLICQNLRDAKRYLKTDYRVHCQQHYSTCADHCRKFALSDPVDPELQRPCPRQHQSTCEQCQGLKDVPKEVRLAIEGSSWKPYSSEQREDVLYDFDSAQSDILLWKAHILKSYVHIFDSCQQDWYVVCSIIENTLEVVKKKHPQITQVNLRSDEAGCYHNIFLLAAVRDAGRRVGMEVPRYDFSEPHYGKDICDRILCPMKSSIRRYCNEGHGVVSAKDMRVALSERPVQGTTASVCAINETQKTLEVHKIQGFSKYHNFKFKGEGIRAWRDYGVGLGRFIPYREVITEPQGSTDLIVHENFFPLKEALAHKRETNSENEQSNGLFSCSEPGCNMVFKKFSGLENHLDVGEHSQVRRNLDTVYDKLRRDWAEKFRTVDKDE